MKILFFMLHPGYVRNYESTIRLLAEKGHKVTLVFNQPKKQAEDQLPEMLVQKTRNIRISDVPFPKRAVKWRYLSRAIYGGMDYLRYFNPIYDNAPKFKERVKLRLGRVFGATLNVLLFMTKGLGVRAISSLLKKTSKFLPINERLGKLILLEKPDFVLVTPLVNIASDQTDVFQFCKANGIRNALCVASWDNLTNKGLCRIEPDIVFVWNEKQKQEAIDLHGISSNRVYVTGAQCYDKWFEETPSLLKDQFLQKVGLPTHTEYVLYLCSSPFIAPDEVSFVESWIKSIRTSDNLNLRDRSILIRPHPQNATQWKDVDFSDFENVSIYPREGANPVRGESKADFYHSMFYSSCVVGVNSSAMIESGILDKPCLTIVSNEFRNTQEGTLHFRYLVEGGLLYISNDLDQHSEQLNLIFGGDDSHIARIRNFVTDFVRPHGLDRSCTPIFIDIIEKIRGLPAPIPLKLPRGTSVARFFLLPISILLIFLQEGGWSGVKKRLSRSNKGRGFRGIRKKIKVFKSIKKRVYKKKNNLGQKQKNKSRAKNRSLYNSLLGLSSRCVRNNSFIKKRIVPWLIKEEVGKMASSSRIFELEKTIKKIASSGKRIVIGPWLSEIGFEVLYWIPFLNRILKEYNIDPERIIIVSRGGTELWYGNIGTTYIDVFDYFTEDEFRIKNEGRILDAGGQKHRKISGFDREILKHVEACFDIQDYELLHPLVMYDMFIFYWNQRHSISLIGKKTDYQMFRPAPMQEYLENLPDEYVAVKFYFSECFPDNKANRAFITGVLEQLVRKTHVVILSTGLNIDDHEDFSGKEMNRIHYIKESISPRNNLEVQTRILCRATAFIGTYGGFSYLSPFYGVPSVSFYSRGDKFLPVHLEVANRGLRVLKYGGFNKIKKLETTEITNGNPEFFVFNVNSFNLLRDLFEREVVHDIKI